MKNFLHSISHPKFGRYTLGAKPSTDWLVIFGNFLLLTSLLVLLSISQYGLWSNGIVDPDSSGKPELLSTKLLNRVTGEYDARAAAYDDLSRRTVTLPDPSK